MKYILHKQLPRDIHKAIEGSLSVHKDEAYLFNDNNMPIAKLTNVKLKFINPDGIFLLGTEEYGYEENGRQKYLYQEWFLEYAGDDK